MTNSMNSSEYLHCNGGVSLVVKTLTRLVRDAGSNPAPYFYGVLWRLVATSHSETLEQVFTEGVFLEEFCLRRCTIRKISYVLITAS